MTNTNLIKFSVNLTNSVNILLKVEKYMLTLINVAKTIKYVI